MTTAILARRQLRLATFAALQSLEGMGDVESPPATATAPRQMPYAGVRCGNERKAGDQGARQPKFTTTATIEILGRVAATTAGAAQDALEDLGARIEAAVFGAPTITALVQKFSNVTTTTEISGEGSAYQAALEMSVDCELLEVFDPVLINPGNYPALEGINLHVDTQRPFDANGIFAASPFPSSVTSAPRTVGPDGRDEVVANVDLPT